MDLIVDPRDDSIAYVTTDCGGIYKTTNRGESWFETHKDWLLIYDNADEPRILVPYLPKSCSR